MMTLLIDIYILITTNIVFTTCVVCFMGFTVLIAHSFIYPYLIHKNFIFVSLMLPPLVLIVTKVISTNLYLSLGMIGALSIVRFRTPVKSQYELSLYFAYICIGIVSGVNMKYAILIYILLISIALIYKLGNLLFPNLLININSANNNEKYTLNVVIKNEIDNNFIEKYSLRQNLIKIDTNKTNNESILIMVFETINTAIKIKDKLSSLETTKSISLSKY